LKDRLNLKGENLQKIWRWNNVPSDVELYYQGKREGRESRTNEAKGFCLENIIRKKILLNVGPFNLEEELPKRRH